MNMATTIVVAMILSCAAADGRTAVFHEGEGFFLVGEAGLGLFGDGCEASRIGVPAGDAAVVFATVFIVDDEGLDAVAQAFFDHQHSANATIAVLEGMDGFEASVEIQDVVESDFLLALIFGDQSA